MNEHLLQVVFWNEKGESFAWDIRNYEEISLILQCGVITNSFEDDTLVNRPYKIIGHSYNILNKDNNRQEVNIYLEEIKDNKEFYRTRG
ncbi:hypothetical protein CYK72_15965 [Clostridium perfringens]|uniref:hypothetical protein n=1 Tax=Clostridium perfringens TaxID=1502 RepID=UPI000D70B58C|nr:hypothetical protein [Clostridium perfringens]MBO3392534.1 hypothetical protein [Clostridium perfringens]PWX44859.1 hypothetical protein CYK72_15965 [Clostridium perfringens]